MFEASVCRSSDISGDSETICWKLALMLRCSASISSSIAVGELLRRLADVGQQVGPAGDHAVEPHARQALHDDAQAAVGQLEHLVDVAGGADGVAGRPGAGPLRTASRWVKTAIIRPADDGLVDQPHRALAGHRQRHERVGEQHRVAQRQHGQLGRNVERLLGRRIAGLESIFLIAHRDPPDDTAGGIARETGPVRDAGPAPAGPAAWCRRR